MDETNLALYVVDDEPAIRRFAADVASSIGAPCQVFSSAERFLDRVDHSLPGCVIYELHLHVMNGLDLQQRLVRLDSIIAVVIVSADLDVPAVVRAMQNGAITVFEKPCEPGPLTDAIHAAFNLSLVTLKTRRRWTTLQRCFDHLDLRERQVMAMIVGGLPNKLIARKLGVYQRTAARIRADVLEKMGVESAVELAQMAVLLAGLPPKESPRTGPIRLLDGCHATLADVHTACPIPQGATQ
jgi:FixJ family two-component response regulator